MNESNVDGIFSGEGLRTSDSGSVLSDTSDGQNALEPGADIVSGGNSVFDIFGADGEYLYTLQPRVDAEEFGIEPFATMSQMGYQVSTYWQEYFKGVLSKLGDVDYIVFSTREGSTQSYVQHYYLYYGDEMFTESGQFIPGTYRCIDGYTSNSIYYVDEYSSYINTVYTDRLYFSNVGEVADIRTEVSHAQGSALLFFLGFFAVYTVCHDLFDYVLERIYRK